ncbi:MAG: TonB-dependent receptor [Spirosomataceae bacterium]
MKHFHYFLLLFFSLWSTAEAQQRVTISGYVREKGSQEQLIGVNVYLPGTTLGTTSNTYGFYSLTLAASDTATIAFSMVGYERIVKQIALRQNLSLNVELEPVTQLQTVEISAKRQSERISETAQMSQIELPIHQIKKIPAFLGEKDVMKVLQLMPGVQKGSEGQSGLYVRGGGPDQNLIILDDAPVYNANHLFGFFSTFNGDALKSVELTKGGFPARFGGRLSSVIELNMKEGNKQELHGEGGIGLIASRLTLEGPIKKNKASFVVSARRTYLDILAQPLIKASQKGQIEQTTGGYYFYDFNAKFNYDFGQKDKLYASGYFGQDKFYADLTSPTLASSSSLDWGNATSTLRWNHLFSQKLFANTSVIFSRYHFRIFDYSKDTQSTPATELSLNYLSEIRDWGFKTDFDFFPSPKHAVKFGLSTTFHHFKPSALVVEGYSTSLSREAKVLDNRESGLYIEDVWQATDRLKMNVGFRLSSFETDSTHYLRPEPRFSMAYKIGNDMSLKASYARMNQYIHLISNTGLGLPTDLWVPTTNRIRPQQSEQVAAGFAKDFDKQGFTLSIEGYYKAMNDIISYKEGASFLNVNGENAREVNWEDNITTGKGWSYGVEVLIQKKVGRFSGWIGYTWSKTQWQFPAINFGRVFFPRYDRRHDLSVVGIYELSKRITLSATWVYGTGNALTVPLAEYSAYQNNYLRMTLDQAVNPTGTIVWNSRRVNEYSEKNAFRAEPYHRLDIGIQFHKKMKRHERTWEFSVYNAYNRRNPFFYTLSSEVRNGVDTTIMKRYSVFPIIPSVSYQFKF